MQVLDKGFVELVDSMGNDMSVVRAARVSYNKDTGSKGEEADKKLVGYLMKHRHTSPFESVAFTFHVKAPLFVFRQWHRHRTWSYSELSARYTEMTDEFYVPDTWRLQDTKNRQGSDGESWEPETWKVGLNHITQLAMSTYQAMLDGGVAREQARMVLPVNLYSRMFATVDLHNLFHFLKLRLDKHAQYEIRVYAEAILEIIEPIVPWAVAAWKECNT